MKRSGDGANMEVMKHATTFLLPCDTGGSDSDSPSYAVVFLNQRLPLFAPLLWSRAQLRVCADGSANRIFDELPKILYHEDLADVRRRFKPDVIKGDMDSIRSDVLEFYVGLGTKIVDESHDQDTTDLHKCVAYIQETTPELNKTNLKILVAGALGGRFDHEVGNLNVLYKFPDVRIVLLSDDCLIQLLPKNYFHEIHIQPTIEGPHCGLIPLNAISTRTTTTGLQWDLNNTEMKFGGLISTSNIAREGKITVQSDSDILWTISIRKAM